MHCDTINNKNNNMDLHSADQTVINHFGWGWEQKEFFQNPYAACVFFFLLTSQLQLHGRDQYHTIQFSLISQVLKWDRKKKTTTRKRHSNTHKWISSNVTHVGTRAKGAFPFQWTNANSGTYTVGVTFWMFKKQTKKTTTQKTPHPWNVYENTPGTLIQKPTTLSSHRQPPNTTKCRLELVSGLH